MVIIDEETSGIDSTVSVPNNSSVNTSSSILINTSSSSTTTNNSHGNSDNQSKASTKKKTSIKDFFKTCTTPLRVIPNNHSSVSNDSIQNINSDHPISSNAIGFNRMNEKRDSSMISNSSTITHTVNNNSSIPCSTNRSVHSITSTTSSIACPSRKESSWKTCISHEVEPIIKEISKRLKAITNKTVSVNPTAEQLHNLITSNSSLSSITNQLDYGMDFIQNNNIPIMSNLNNGKRNKVNYGNMRYAKVNVGDLYSKIVKHDNKSYIKYECSNGLTYERSVEKTFSTVGDLYDYLKNSFKQYRFPPCPYPIAIDKSDICDSFIYNNYLVWSSKFDSMMSKGWFDITKEDKWDYDVNSVYQLKSNRRKNCNTAPNDWCEEIEIFQNQLSKEKSREPQEEMERMYVFLLYIIARIAESTETDYDEENGLRKSNLKDFCIKFSKGFSGNSNIAMTDIKRRLLVVLYTIVKYHSVGMPDLSLIDFSTL